MFFNKMQNDVAGNSQNCFPTFQHSPFLVLLLGCPKSWKTQVTAEKPFFKSKL